MTALPHIGEATMVEAVHVRTPGLIRSELLKLKGSRVFWMTIAVPSFVLLLASLVVLTEGSNSAMFVAGGLAIWGTLVLPLGTMALTVILAQIEHQPRAWDPLLSLPGARRRIFLIKLAAGALVLAGWSVLLGGGLLALAAFFKAVLPAKMAGDPVPVGEFATLVLRVWAASFFMLVVQYGLALFFRGFILPITIGIGGIITAGVAASSEYGQYFPWLMPLNQLATEGAPADTALWLGIGGGIVGAIILQLAMQRREW